MFLLWVSSSRLIRRGPFCRSLSYRTYWCSSSSSWPSTYIVNCVPHNEPRHLTVFMSQSFGLFHYLKNFGYMLGASRFHRDEQHCVILNLHSGHRTCINERAHLKQNVAILSIIRHGSFIFYHHLVDLVSQSLYLCYSIHSCLPSRLGRGWWWWC